MKHWTAARAIALGRLDVHGELETPNGEEHYYRYCARGMTFEDAYEAAVAYERNMVEQRKRRDEHRCGYYEPERTA